MNALVILIASLLALISFALWVNTKQQLNSLKQQFQQPNNSLFNNQLSALNAGAIGLGKRYVAMQKEIKALTARIDDLQLQVQTQTPYAQAIQLIQHGHTEKDLVDLCNISFNEAQLLMKLHQQDKAA